MSQAYGRLWAEDGGAHRHVEVPLSGGHKRLINRCDCFLVCLFNYIFLLSRHLSKAAFFLFDLSFYFIFTGCATGDRFGDSRENFFPHVSCCKFFQTTFVISNLPPTPLLGFFFFGDEYSYASHGCLLIALEVHARCRSGCLCI